MELMIQSDDGIPVTLVSLPTSSASSAPPKLTPFPSWDMHLRRKGDCNKIIEVNGLDVDSAGRLWVLDRGNGLCNGKIWTIDLNNNDRIELIHQFSFHDWMHYLVLDETNDGTFAYISRWERQNIIVFSLERNESWIVEMPGIEVFSIALSSPKDQKRRQLYLSKYYSNELFSTSVAELRKGSRFAIPELIGKWIAEQPYRMLIDNHGTMYAAFLWENYILSWNTFEPFQHKRFYRVSGMFANRQFTFSLDPNGTNFWMTEIDAKREPRYMLRLVKAAFGEKSSRSLPVTPANPTTTTISQKTKPISLASTESILVTTESSTPAEQLTATSGVQESRIQPDNSHKYRPFKNRITYKTDEMTVLYDNRGYDNLRFPFPDLLAAENPQPATGEENENQLNVRRVYEWPEEFDYEWPSKESRTEALEDGTYDPKARIKPLHMAVYGTRLFLGLFSVDGIPVTLVSLPTSSASSAPPKLTPFPSWDMHLRRKGDCNKIIEVNGLDVDSAGRLWVLDRGNVLCNGKIWTIDLNNNDRIELIHQFSFHDWMHYLVLDETNDGTFAYISRWEQQNIIVFSLERNESRIVKTPGIEVFSIALSPKDQEPRKLYLSKYYSDEMFSISVAALHSGTGIANPKLIGKWIAEQPYRMLIDNHGTMYAAFLWENYILSWNTSQPFQHKRFYRVSGIFANRQFTFSLDQNGTCFWIAEIDAKKEPRYMLRLVKAAFGEKSSRALPVTQANPTTTTISQKTKPMSLASTESILVTTESSTPAEQSTSQFGVQESRIQTENSHKYRPFKESDHL
ncbi:Hypothetical predicted protein [Cloeon dipterum]|uniref:Bee-milk protein n=1 Tax=Cloeon dipterum TaxID=197152 RepID=A0A8S1DRG8_9INSE|nr:Hypothetical predicted protein [Cloeon dipterum]